MSTICNGFKSDIINPVFGIVTLMLCRPVMITIDQKQAVHWYSKAAKQGDADAQYNLGIMYARGEGVALDNKRALFWFKKSAAQGHVGAQGVLDAVP